MSYRQLQRVGMEIKTSLSLYDWDAALSAQFALAPPDLIRRGKVNRRSYLRQNHLLGKIGALAMIPEIFKIVGNPFFEKGPKGFEFLGWGLGRDVSKFLIHPIMRSFDPICITDSSAVAYANAEEFKSTYDLPLSICQSDIEEAWGYNFISDELTLVYYAGQLIQNLDYDSMNRVMKHFGKFLKIPTSRGRRDRKVYLLHPRGEDNPPNRVKWRNTIPWFVEKDLRPPLQRGYGGPVNIDVIRRHNYWDHQRYVWLRLSAP